MFDKDFFVDLMIKSSSYNPYTGSLSEKQNLREAIGLALLCKEFADNGQADEAMNVNSEQWIEVIDVLRNKLSLHRLID